MQKITSLVALLAAWLVGTPPALSADLITEKKAFYLPTYTTTGGKPIEHVRVGYETYGRLNSAGDNAIFVAHFFSGNSHAAGKYKVEDKSPGYWNSIIGPGKPIDTDQYFVVSADTLANPNAKDPSTITTGPATVNPATSKPYGMSFPVVTLRDSVQVHKALMDALGVKRLQAVIGRSGGSMQAFEWAALYPDYVDRVVAITSPGLSLPAYSIAMADVWTTPVRLDPNWAGGDYYGAEEPIQGVAEALKIITLSAVSFDWAESNFGSRWASNNKNPADSVGTLFAVQDAMTKAGAARAEITDANSLIFTAKAHQLYDLRNEAQRMKAKVLLVPVKSDLIFPPELSRRAADELRKQGNMVEEFEIDSNGGHAAAGAAITLAAEAIRSFLSR